MSCFSIRYLFLVLVATFGFLHGTLGSKAKYLTLEIKVCIKSETFWVGCFSFDIYVDGWGQVRPFLRSKYDLAERQTILHSWWRDLTRNIFVIAPVSWPVPYAGDANRQCVCSNGFILGRQVEMCHMVALTLEHGKKLEISYPSVYLTLEGHPKPGGLNITRTCFISSGPQISFWVPSGELHCQEDIQSDQKVPVHLMITIQIVTSKVQSVSRRSPDIDTPNCVLEDLVL